MRDAAKSERCWGGKAPFKIKYTIRGNLRLLDANRLQNCGAIQTTLKKKMKKSRNAADLSSSLSSQWLKD